MLRNNQLVTAMMSSGETYSLDDDEDMAIKEIQNLWILEAEQVVVFILSIISITTVIAIVLIAMILIIIGSIPLSLKVRSHVSCRDGTAWKLATCQLETGQLGLSSGSIKKWILEKTRKLLHIVVLGLGCMLGL